MNFVGEKCWFKLFLLCVSFSIAAPLYAEQDEVTIVDVELGDYRYMPGTITLVEGEPVILRLKNVDMVTPHNFILEDPSDGLDTSVDVPAGKTVEVHLMPIVPGEHTFYCSKKLLFMKSHREKGMEGKLVVKPK